MGPAFGRGLDSIHPRERPQLRPRLQYHHRSPRQYLRSLRGLIDTRHGWDLGHHRLCLRGELGGPGPPRGPAHWAQRVIFLSASAITSHIGCRGDIIASVVACLQDQEVVVRREPHFGECTTPSQTVPSGVVLRRPSLLVPKKCYFEPYIR